jgi:hypothetical protein
MQFNVKALLSHRLLIAVSLIVVVIMVYFFRQEAASSHLPRFKPAAQAKLQPQPQPQPQPAAEILDRLPLVREDPFILPANEVYKDSYKDCTTGDDTLYSKDAPLFKAGDKTDLVAPNINSPQRRVNFVELH